MKLESTKMKACDFTVEFTDGRVLKLRCVVDVELNTDGYHDEHELYDIVRTLSNMAKERESVTHKHVGKVKARVKYWRDRTEILYALLTPTYLVITRSQEKRDKFNDASHIDFVKLDEEAQARFSTGGWSSMSGHVAGDN